MIQIGVDNGGLGGAAAPPPMLFAVVTIQIGCHDSRKGAVEYRRAAGGLAGVTSPMMLEGVHTYNETRHIFRRLPPLLPRRHSFRSFLFTDVVTWLLHVASPFVPLPPAKTTALLFPPLVSNG